MEGKKKDGITFKIGGGIWSVLAMIFIVFKVLGIGLVADWGWWLVLSPLWIPFAIVLLMLILMFLITIIRSF